MQGIGPSIIVVAIRYKDPIDGLNHSDLMDEVISHCELSGASYLLVDDATTSRWAEASVPMQPLFGIGDISFYSNPCLELATYPSTVTIKHCKTTSRDGVLIAIPIDHH